MNSRLRIQQMAMVLVYVGTANAFFGITNYFTQGKFGFFQPASWWEQAISGTYINPNHFAGLMELCLPMALGLIMAGHQQQRFYPNLKARLRGALEFMLSREALLYLFAVIMLAGTFLSSSRGGVASLLIALILGLMLFHFARPVDVPQMRVGRVILPLVILAVGWFGVGGFISKLESAGLDSDRGLIREATYPLIADYPLFGTGTGTYEWIFTLYKKNELGRSVYDHAHNDYLELLSEQGLVGFLLLGLAILLMYWRIIKCLSLRRNAQLRGILFGVVVGTLSLLIHAWVDFNFQIPANAAIFWCLMGLGISCSFMKSKRSRGH
ncbi:MAG: O-antigen ligase family protein [Candidatus Polarisedimenticolaceae bacterium]|nr:O-antigen ligase family protein [Candidatus Polarisedimenticolaceae bacterium]